MMAPRGTHLLLAVLIAGLTIVLPSVAFAADDGGGRSVFSYGAGNRALGLGGAFSAIADDASASLWNPGGLGRLSRREFQLTQTSYYGLNINEQYAALVFPHWRWGVASLSFQHFGVSGIERRDSRNVLLDDNLSDSETEFSLGYGRSIGTAWSVGGTIKMRRHSLAGLSGGGIGMDIGVLAQPLAVLYPNHPAAHRLTLGMSLRNVLEPKVRLVTESVPDPTGVRFGGAYLLPFFGQRTLLAALDIEKTKGMNSRLHTGFEMQVHPLITLRAGFNDGSFATGTGMRWKDAGIEYVFEQNEIEDVHRFGATFTFGPTVEEARQTALDARENELQERLAEAFERKQAERVTEMLGQADEARRNGDFEKALELLAVVSAIKPDDETTKLRQAAAYRGLGNKLEEDADYAAASISYSRALSIIPDDEVSQAGYDRCRLQSDQMAARSETIRKQFSDALDAFSENRLTEARDAFASILKATPNDSEAEAMLSRTQRAIDNKVADLLSEANRVIDWGHFDAAASLIAEARALDHSAKRISTLETKLAKARADRSGPQNTQVFNPPVTTNTTRPPVVVNTLSEDQRQEVERLYSRGVVALTNGETDDAVRYLELVWSMDPNYQRVSEHLKREYLTRGMEYFAEGELDRAIELWEKVLRVDPNDQKAKGYLSRAREQVTRTREILGGNK